MTTAKILIDTDPGVDDTLAIYTALGMAELRIDAITTCAGNAPIEKVTRNAKFICRKVGFPEERIFAGSTGSGARSAVVHGGEGLGGVVPHEAPVPVGDRAVQAILRFLREGGSEQRTIVAIAPLSNIAAALRADADAFRHCTRLVVLGGTFTAPGNSGPVAEFNFHCDPEAADYVLAHCPCEIAMIPLDLCFRAVIPVCRFAEVQDPSLRRFLEQLCEFYSAANRSEEGIEGVILYDPLAIYCAAHPERFRFEPYAVRVDCGKSFARGYVVADRRLGSKQKPNVSIALDADLQHFYKAFISGLNAVQFREDGA